MQQNWTLAKVVHSLPYANWGLAETSEQKIVFFRWVRAVILQMEGLRLVAKPATLPIPALGAEIAFCGLIPAENGGNYEQAAQWTTVGHFAVMQAKLDSAQAKAAETQAALAAEIMQQEAKRREAMARIAKKRHGSGNKQGGKKQKGKKAA